MEPTEWTSAIERDGRWIASISPDDLAVAVPTTPGWTVADLIGHLGGVHRWATSYLVAGPDGTRPKPDDPAPPPGPELLAWYRRGLDGLLAEIGAHNAAEPTRSFAGATVVGFWIRRQAHETAIHRWDLDHAIHGDDAQPIPTALAIDGIDEWLTFFVQRFLVHKGAGVPAELAGRSVHLHCTDEPAVDRTAGPAEATGEWLIRLDADRIDVEHAHAKGDAAMRGSASDLNLAVWHRLPLDQIDIVGDAAVADAFLDAVHIG